MSEANPLLKLSLPKRFEILEANAKEAGFEAQEFVERVDAAARRVDTLLRNVDSTGCGQLELFLGLSGSGKTTFVATLPKFFKEISVHLFAKERPLGDLPTFVAATGHSGARHRVILISGRDNPTRYDTETAREIFDRLREVFRTPAGRALVLWPITADTEANALADIAWAVGRDSIVDQGSKGLFIFEGLPKDRFYEVADLTSRNLSGDGLEAFGITVGLANSLLPEADTIGAYYALIEQRAALIRDETWSILKERIRPRVWILLPGDDPDAIDATVLGLTQGTRSRIDTDLVAEFIDNPTNNANYISDWRARRARLAHIMRALDVRLFGLPPNVSLAAIRACGDSSVRSNLKQPSANLSSAKETLRRSRLYKAIALEAGKDSGAYVGGGSIGDETMNEYRRIQKLASAGDKALNKALGQLIALTLQDDGIECEVSTERQRLPGSTLKPDIQIKLDSQTYICIEPTWRSTDKGIPGELPGGQNTLAVAHIKKYVLDKVSEYVKDLDL